MQHFQEWSVTRPFPLFKAFLELRYQALVLATREAGSPLLQKPFYHYAENETTYQPSDRQSQVEAGYL